MTTRSNGGKSVLEILSYSHAVRVLNKVREGTDAQGATQFKTIMTDLALNPNQVNQRLINLKHQGLVKQRSDERYVVTDRGREALRIAERLQDL